MFNLKKEKPWNFIGPELYQSFLKKIRFHSIQGSVATTRHGVTRKGRR